MDNRNSSRACFVLPAVLMVAAVWPAPCAPAASKQNKGAQRASSVDKRSTLEILLEDSKRGAALDPNLMHIFEDSREMIRKAEEQVRLQEKAAKRRKMCVFLALAGPPIAAALALCAYFVVRRRRCQPTG